MAVFVCPSCGVTSEKPDEYTGYKVKCNHCGRTTAVASKLSPGIQRKQKGKGNKHTKPSKTRILVPVALCMTAAILAVLFFPKSKPKKTEFRDLNQDEVDNEILAVGMSALEDQGWSESETAFYIETRLQMYRASNKQAREVYRSRGSSSNELTAKSSASDIKELGQSELRQVYKEIEDTDNRIKEFQRILADYRQAGKPDP